MKLRLLHLGFLITCLTFGGVAMAQLTPQGVQVIVGTAVTLGRQVRGASTDYKAQKEQKELDANYEAVVGQADDLFAKKDYEKALEKYRIAAEMKEDDRVNQQIAACNAELAILNRTPYDDLLDKGDSCSWFLNFDGAIEFYSAAAVMKNDKVANDRLSGAKKNKQLWHSVQFSNVLISDTSAVGQTSRVMNSGATSDFFQVGNYPFISDSLRNVAMQTLDGIAVPAGIKLTIYSEPNFKGEVIVDVVGPMIINNIARNVSSDTQEIQIKPFDGELNKRFPPKTRIWSNGDMFTWTNGSMKITAL